MLLPDIIPRLYPRASSFPLPDGLPGASPSQAKILDIARLLIRDPPSTGDHHHREHYHHTEPSSAPVASPQMSPVDGTHNCESATAGIAHNCFFPLLPEMGASGFDVVWRSKHRNPDWSESTAQSHRSYLERIACMKRALEGEAQDPVHMDTMAPHSLHHPFSTASKAIRRPIAIEPWPSIADCGLDSSAGDSYSCQVPPYLELTYYFPPKLTEFLPILSNPFVHF
jgi:hypothetical protein